MRANRSAARLRQPQPSRRPPAGTTATAYRASQQSDHDVQDLDSQPRALVSNRHSISLTVGSQVSGHRLILYRLTQVRFVPDGDGPAGNRTVEH